MRTRLFGAFFAPVFALGLAACTVEQTEEGDPAELPEYDVDPADVDVDWDTTTVRVPDVDIDSDPDTARADTSATSR